MKASLGEGGNKSGFTCSYFSEQQVLCMLGFRNADLGYGRNWQGCKRKAAEQYCVSGDRGRGSGNHGEGKSRPFCCFFFFFFKLEGTKRDLVVKRPRKMEGA